MLRLSTRPHRVYDVHIVGAENLVSQGLAVLGAATSVPTFAQVDAAARSALVEAVTHETQTVAQRYRDGGRLTFPMSTHIALAQPMLRAAADAGRLGFKSCTAGNLI